MRRALSGYRRADLVGVLDAYRQRVEAAGRARAERLRAADEAIAVATEAVSAVETQVGGELERIRALLNDLTAWNEHVRQHVRERVAEAKARYDAEEARELAALRALEGQLAARRATAESLSREVLGAVGRTQAALSAPAAVATPAAVVALADAAATRPDAAPGPAPAQALDDPARLPEPLPPAEPAPEPAQAGRGAGVLWLANGGQTGS